MNKIIVVFPKRETAVKIRNILMRGGMDTTDICTTGAQALQQADLLEEGIVVCGYRMQDMLYIQLREYLPENFEMLLISLPDRMEASVRGVVMLPMPVKVYDLLNTIEMIQETLWRRKRRRREEAKRRGAGQKAVIEQAKALLMERNHMTEKEAHRYLQKCSMDSGTNMTEMAQMVLTIMRD